MSDVGHRAAHFWPIDAQRGNTVWPAAYRNASLLLVQLTQAITQRGDSVTHTLVARLRYDQQHVLGPQTTTGTKRFADHVVVAAGMATHPLMAQLGVGLPLLADASQVLEIYVPHSISHILLGHGRTLVPKSEQTILLTGIHRRNAEDAAPTPDRKRLLSGAQQLLGTHDMFAVGCAWSGVRPATRDGMPIIEVLHGLVPTLMLWGAISGNVYIESIRSSFWYTFIRRMESRRGEIQSTVLAFC